MLERLALPSAQIGIWSGQRLDPGSPVYNAGEYVDIAGPVDAEIFTAALRHVFGGAEALHARYADGPVFTVAEPSVDVNVADLRSDADPAAAALARMRELLRNPADLAAGPLFQLALLRIADEHWWWYLQVHHIAADGYTFAMLVRRVAEVYTALHAGAGVTDGFTPLSAALVADAAYDPAADREFWLARSAGRPTRSPSPQPDPKPRRSPRPAPCGTPWPSPATWQRAPGSSRSRGRTWPWPGSPTTSPAAPAPKRSSSACPSPTGSAPEPCGCPACG